MRDIHQDQDDAAIAHAVIAMAHKLGIKVIAEGVECLEQLDLLREFSCNHIQGYYFSRPGRTCFTILLPITERA